MSVFPSDPKKIRERIRRYERELARDWSDGSGKRFLLGPLYMLFGDVDGALASFEWYEAAYPEDSGEPFHSLTWALALYRGRKPAAVKLYQTMLQNPYLVPHLLGEQPRRLDIWHGSNLSELQYALDTPEELLTLWNDDERAWARQTSQHPEITKRMTRYIEIHRKLQREPVGRRRNALVDEADELMRSDFSI